MTNAWWDRGDRRTTRAQIAMRAGAAFAAVALTLSISWPVGIGLAVVVCAIATVLANRMLQAGEQTADTVVDLAALLA
ncbi:MAG TPA: hypothetical protein VIG76_15000 [Amnibacterium sp.]|uniref:hypothetical protein n=1 Tax=Amnibacterium sp. TaxID=1872496 RepID=UPI002F95DD11